MMWTLVYSSPQMFLHVRPVIVEVIQCHMHDTQSEFWSINSLVNIKRVLFELDTASINTRVSARVRVSVLYVYVGCVEMTHWCSFHSIISRVCLHTHTHTHRERLKSNTNICLSLSLSLCMLDLLMTSLNQFYLPQCGGLRPHLLLHCIKRCGRIKYI